MKNLIPIILILINISCAPQPEVKISQYKQEIDYTITKDSLKIKLKNPLKCDLQIDFDSDNKYLRNELEKKFPFILRAKTDTILYHRFLDSNARSSFSITHSLGNPNKKVKDYQLTLPFQKNKKTKIIQGYLGKFSHRSDYSKYAIDFDMDIGDTVYSAEYGWVVGVVEGYKNHGKSLKWRDYANFITIYHPELNLFTQYVHLDYFGSIVEVGDEVFVGEAIGISGFTGRTTIPHLHFNVLEAKKGELISRKARFKSGYKGENMKTGRVVMRKK